MKTYLDRIICTAIEFEKADYSTILDVKPNPQKKKTNKIDGLLVLDKETIESHGLCPGGKYKYITDVNEAINLLNHWIVNKCHAAIDLETGVAWRELPDKKTGEQKKTYINIIDPYTCPIYLCSISVKNGFAYVFDMRVLMKFEGFLKAFKIFLTECKLIAHNSFFEFIFLKTKFKINPNFVFDTLLASKLLTAGKPIGNGLDDLMWRHFNIKMDKKWQTFFLTIHPTGPIPNEAIAYSGGDVCQLLNLTRILNADLRDTNLSHIYYELEHPFIQIAVDATINGFGIDIKYLESLKEEASKLKEEHHQRFIKYIGTHTVTRGIKNPITTVEPIVSISSNLQLKKWFISRGVNVPGVDENVLNGIISNPMWKNQIEAEVAQIILNWRKVDKVLNTYINPLLTKFPNPITGKIHPIWKQLQAVTGRMACESPPMQQIPSESEWTKIRSVVVAEKRCKLIYADFSNFELRAIAELSGEPRMVKAFQNGDDLHSNTASILFDVPLDKVTKDQRKVAKVFNFALIYGAGPKALAEQTGISKEKAKELLEVYYENHPILKRYLDLQKLYALQQGWTETPAGRRRYYHLEPIGDKVERLTHLKDDSPEDWNNLTEKWYTNDLFEMAQKMCRFEKASAEREGANHPIQGVNADVTKLASIMFNERKNYRSTKIIMWLHDEIVIQVKDIDDNVEKEASTLEWCMKHAAQKWIKKVPLEINVVTADCWSK